MQIDWNQTINEIFSDKLSCFRCGSLSSEIVAVDSAGHRLLAEYSPCFHECAHKEECDARKLVVVCEACC